LQTQAGDCVTGYVDNVVYITTQWDGGAGGPRVVDISGRPSGEACPTVCLSCLTVVKFAFE